MPKNMLLVALSLFLWGCATGSSGPEDGSPAPRAGRELMILDYMETDLPRAAYMAKFEIIPELGVSLLYPTREEEFQQVGPGIHRLPFAPSAFVWAQRDKYISRITGLLNSGPGPISSVSVLVVVSDQPLNLDPFLRSPGGLRDHLGGTTYVNEILAREAILETVIGDPGIAVTEYRISTVSVPSGAWFRR